MKKNLQAVYDLGNQNIAEMLKVTNSANTESQLEACLRELQTVNLEIILNPNNQALKLRRAELEHTANSLTPDYMKTSNKVDPPQESNPRRDQSAKRLGSNGEPGQDNLDDNGFIAGSRGDYDLESLALASAQADAEAKKRKDALENAKKNAALKGTPVIKSKPVIVITKPQSLSNNTLLRAENSVRKDLGL